MRLSNAVIKYLYDNGVRHAFGIPTAQIAGFSDGLNDFDIDYIVVKNEAAATYSAGRYADIKRDLGVCFLGGCVGINNAINGIGDAYRNKLPLVVITSVVKRSMMGKNALQELETTKITAPITKYSKTLLDESTVMEELKTALEIALTPPFGPVHLSIPSDIQMLPFEGTFPALIDRDSLIPPFDATELNKAVYALNQSQTGIIMVGRGARHLSEEIKQLSEKLQWPLITTPNAKGLVNSDFYYNLGNYGYCTTDAAKDYVDHQSVDCLLILGSSLGQMSTRVYKDTLFNNRTIIHLDWDKTELNKVIPADIPVLCDLNLALPILNKSVYQKSNSFVRPEINAPYKKDHTGLSLRLAFEKLVECLPEDTRFLQDMGGNMNFSFKYMPLKASMDFLTSIHYAAMGTAVAGSLGAFLAEPERTYAVIVGDGAFYMNGLEILTAKEYHMPIIYFVVNNAMLGLVEHGGNLNFGRNHKGPCTFNRFSIADMAKSMDIDAVQITEIDQLNELILEPLNGPLVVELITDGSEFCLDTDRWPTKK